MLTYIQLMLLCGKLLNNYKYTFTYIYIYLFNVM